MDKLTRRAIWNAVSLVEKLKPGEVISREDLVDALRRPLPPDVRGPSDAVLRHAYQVRIIRSGIEGAEREIVTYSEAAELAEVSEESLRQAAARSRLTKLGVWQHGRERRGITLQSLAEFKRWPLERFQEAAAQVARWREAE